MSNQPYNSVKYSSRSQEFYNDYFRSKNSAFYKQKVREFKIFSGTDPITKKRVSKSVKLFNCTIHNAPNKSVFRINLSDIFEESTGEDYNVNMDWLKRMDKQHHHYCFSNGSAKYVNGKFVSCTHTICDYVYGELMSMFNNEHPFQEFLYVNMANDFVKVHQAIKVQTFPTEITDKLETPFFKFNSNGGVIISCNFLALKPDVNVFKMDISTSEVFEVTILPSLSPAITFAQVSNGCLHLHALNSLDISGDIATVSKNVCIPTHITDLLPAKILNINISDFKNQTYPIRNKTDRTIEALLYPLGVMPCKVAPRLSNSDYNQVFDKYFELICDFLGRQDKNVNTLGDLTRMQRFLNNFGTCQVCNKTLSNVFNKKMIVLECWDNVCDACFQSLKKTHNIVCCPVNVDHERSHCDAIYSYDEKNYMDGLNSFNITLPELDSFLFNNANDRVFSYTLYYNHTDADKNLVERLMEHYTNMKFEKLDFSWNIVPAYFNEPALRSFSLGCRFADDTRPLTCIVTKPTFTNVDISRKFLEIFKNENISALDMRLVDFNNDADYGKLYDVNNKRIWGKYWRDYLGSDFGISFMLRAPSIEGFAKLIEHVYVLLIYIFISV